MLIIDSLITILVIGLMSEKLSWSFFHRKTALVILFSALVGISSTNLENIISGIGLYNGLWQITTMNMLITNVIYIIGGIVLLLGEGKFKGQKLLKPEQSLIIMLSTIGMIALIHSYDLITLFLGLELQSLALYVLATIYKESESATSAGLKYFLLGSLSSSFILLGSGLLYGLTGITNFEYLYMIGSYDLNYYTYLLVPILLILLAGFLFKLAAAPFHNWAPDVYDGVPTLVTSWLAVLPKISILIIMVEIFNNIFYQIYSLSNIILFSSFLSLILGSLLGLAQYRIKRLLAYSTIVRRCAITGFEEPFFLHCPNMQTATRLGQRESPSLNLASLLKGEIRSTQGDRLALRAVTSMVKAKLLEVYLRGASTIGPQFACNRLWEANPSMKLLLELWTVFSRVVINNFNVEKGQPKEVVGSVYRTSGLPKVGNNYGNRGIVVPAGYFGNLYENLNRFGRGRISGLDVRMFCSAAESSSTVKSDSTIKLLKLANYCKENPDIQIRDQVYRLMYDNRLFEMAYHNIRSKPGNMTPGIVPTTLDGMSTEVINDIISNLKDQTFQFAPGRRIMIPKANGGERPLTVAPPRDKLVQEVMRMILEVIFEPTFSESSHGFRTGKSCHTALREVKTKFGVATWYIEGDIAKCFDSINHNKLMEIVEQKIVDRRFTRLIRKALNAGYFEFREFKHSIVGTPQGSIISPILCNIYMDKLDKYIEEIKNDFDAGEKVRLNPKWTRLQNKKSRTSDLDSKLQYHKEMLKTPSRDLMDPNFKRLVYVRYADDWIIGIRGSYKDTQQVLDKINIFLKNELGLNLSLEKTLITNARSERALFLGTSLGRSHHTSFSLGRSGHSKRNIQEIRLEAPLIRINRKLTEAGFLNGKNPCPRFLWLSNSKDEIITLYNSVYRGFINYYSFVMNFGAVSSWIHYVLKTSCAKLLAAKFNLGSQTNVYKEFGKELRGKDNVSFARAELKLNPWNFKIRQNDIINTLYAQSISAASLDNLCCSICSSTYRVEMHHVRHLKDLNPKLSKLDALMASKRRKQIAVCRACHLKYHGLVKSSINSSINKG